MAALLAAATAVAALAAPPGHLTLDRASAQPNDRVTVRGARTTPLRLYLVPASATRSVRGRADRRLTFVGTLVRGRLTFSVPPLDDGTYALATWCRGCGFAVHRGGPRLRLRARTACPVTRPNGRHPPGHPGAYWHGNGMLWASVEPDGVYEVGRDDVAPDGTIGNKLGWATTPATARPQISGARIDAPAPPLYVKSVNLGFSSNTTRPSFMSAVSFPTTGCWRLTGRVGDISLRYVVEVVVRG